MTTTADDLPDDIAALQAALIAERARATRVEAELAVAKARASDDQALIAHQRLQIEKLTRQIYGQRSERTMRLLDQIDTTPIIPHHRARALVNRKVSQSAAASAGDLRAPGANRVSPVDPVKHIS